MTVVDGTRDHFLVVADEPVTIEVCLNGDLLTSALNCNPPAVVAHVYKGTEMDPEREVVGAYDGTLYLPNMDWEV
jgi:hypothetical protein